MSDLTDYMDQRRSALENAFFRQQDEAARERLRAKTDAESLRAMLSTASGVTDEAVLDELVRIDITPETVAAIGIIPLAAIAWADREMDERERAAILKAAAEFGIAESHPAHDLLQNWLTQPLSDDVIDAWKQYIAAVSASMNPEASAALRRDLIGRATKVAEAAGGFLGLGNKVSDVERRTLHELDAAFDVG